MTQLTEIYIRRAQYAHMSRLMGCLSSLNGVTFPVSITQAETLYECNDAEVEIKTPACFVLLSTRQDYDLDHVETMDTTRLVRLVNMPNTPGWWRVQWPPVK